MKKDYRNLLTSEAQEMIEYAEKADEILIKMEDEHCWVEDENGIIKEQMNLSFDKEPNEKMTATIRWESRGKKIYEYVEGERFRLIK